MNHSRTRGAKDRDAGYQTTSDTAVAATPGAIAPFLSKRFPKPGTDGILVCPVGGVGQIGMNWTAYGYAGKWILVDAGSMFAKDVPGIGGVMPDPKSLRGILDNLEALIVTHAHEDHIGGIHHLWPGIKAPIYATPFAVEILTDRLAQKGAQGKVKFKRFMPGSSFEIGPFRIRSVGITHSTPECVGLAISTDLGTIFHTGDWKLDPDPLVGNVTDAAAFRAIGKAGVLAMLCDSTNAEREAPITSEASVARNLAETFRSRRGIMVVSCFATNVARLTAIGKAAAATGRKVAFAGRSLERVDAAARATGLMNEDLPFLADNKHLRGLDRHEIVIVCTGTQGEERAALAKLARRENRHLPEIERGDTVIHSARAIPGNEDVIQAMMDLFRKRGVEVLMGEDAGRSLHVTGHASRGELKTMYNWIRPRFAIPVHGEPSHMAAHAALAESCDVRESILTEEGDVLRVTPRGVQKVASVRIEHLAVQEGSKETLIGWNKAGNAPKHQGRPPIDRKGRNSRRAA
jgi:ribonuclease J